MLGKLKLSGMYILVIVVLIGLGLLGHNWYMIHPTKEQMENIKGKGTAAQASN